MLRRLISVCSILSFSLSVSGAGLIPIEKTKENGVLIDDYEHWPSEKDARNWYWPKLGTSQVFLDKDVKKNGNYSLRLELGKEKWAGWTHYKLANVWGAIGAPDPTFLFDITDCDTMTFWLKGDGSPCPMFMLFKEQPCCTSPPGAIMTLTVPITDKEWHLVKLARSAFKNVGPAWGITTRAPAGPNGTLGDKLEEWNFTTDGTCATGHIIWVDDWRWLPKGKGTVGNKAGMSRAGIASVNPVRMRVGMPLSGTGNPSLILMDKSGSAFDCTGRRIQTGNLLRVEPRFLSERQ